MKKANIIAVVTVVVLTLFAVFVLAKHLEQNRRANQMALMKSGDSVIVQKLPVRDFINPSIVVFDTKQKEYKQVIVTPKQYMDMVVGNKAQVYLYTSKKTTLSTEPAINPPFRGEIVTITSGDTPPYSLQFKSDTPAFSAELK